MILVLRMAETTDGKGKLVRIITNRFDVSTEEICDP
jgi:hypothetical protein